METLGEPKSDGGGPRLFVVALAVALVLAGLATFFVARRPGKEPRPTSAAARPSPAPRSSPSPTLEAPEARAKPESEAAPGVTLSASTLFSGSSCCHA